MNLHSRRFGGGLIQCLTPPTRTRSSKSTCTYPRLSGSGQGTAEQASVNTHRAGGNPTLSAAGAPPLTSVEGARPAQRVRYGQAGIAAQQDDVAIAERMALACHRALNATSSLLSQIQVRRRCLRQYEVWPAHSFIRLTVKSKDPPSSCHTRFVVPLRCTANPTCTIKWLRGVYDWRQAFGPTREDCELYHDTNVTLLNFPQL